MDSTAADSTEKDDTILEQAERADICIGKN